MNVEILKKTGLIVLIVLICGCQPSISKNENRKQLFNYDWKFVLGDRKEFSTINFNDTDWRQLDLPHDWSIEGKSEANNPSEGDGGFFPTGVGWYRKTFDVPSSWKKKKISIYFEGVYMNSEVFINGKSIGRQPYGYTSFNYNLTPYLEYGKQNTIAVRVDNSQQKNSRWYTGSGIYRNVWLTVTEPVHIAHWGVAVTTKKVEGDSAIVSIKALVKNETDKDQDVLVESNLTLDKTFPNSTNRHSFVGSTNGLILKANSEAEVVQDIAVKNSLLWSPDSPDLYNVQIIVRENGNYQNKIDSLELHHGIRTIEFSAENGFVLNGKKTIINGGCIHHDNGALGAAAYDRAEVRKVQLMKQAGFNALRTSHNPPSEAFLNACDSIGMLVMDEVFDGWREKKLTVTPLEHDYATLFNDWWKHDTESMVLRDRNHPSIIMWSIGNEVMERTKPEAVETAKMLKNTVKKIDSTRPVTSAMTTWGQGWDVFDPLMDVHDVAGYNYQLHRAESDHERVPSRIIVNTESYPKNAFFIWNLVQKNSYILGDFVWTAMDYLGESGIGRYYYHPEESKGEHWETNLYPWHGAYCGDVDLIGWRKPISHYRSMLYNDTEKLYMAVKEPNPRNSQIRLTSWAVWPTWESWTWPGYGGKNIEVEVYSKYPKVRLYLNDMVVGEKNTTIEEEFKAVFEVPYSVGELKAVALKDDKEVEEIVLTTAGKAAQITLKPDRKTIKADGQDLVFITVEITDDNGVLAPHAENRLQFNVSGPGEIIGVDNANLKDTDLYMANNRKVWHGRALVIVKSTRKAGVIKVEVSSEGLGKSDITINSGNN